MYPVRKAFLQAVQGNTRKYYWTGKITTAAGAEYPFTQEDIVKGSGYITAQCCGNSEIELGAVYAAEMGISLFLDIDRYTLEDAEVELSYHLRLADGTYEAVPMGIFEVSEANRTVHVLELKAYDRMLRFDRVFNGFETYRDVLYFTAQVLDGFRKDVKAAMGGVGTVEPENGGWYRVRKGWGKLKSGAGWISLDYAKRI